MWSSKFSAITKLCYVVFWLFLYMQLYFRVQVFLIPAFSGSRFFRVQLHGLGPGFRSSSVNGAILNLNKKKRKELDSPCINMLQYSNEEIMFCFWQQSMQTHNLESFRIMLFKVGTCLNFLSLSDMFALIMLQYI